ncbi:MAG: ChaN family lipoprotein [Candidatus Aminicenantales bacterium]
MKLKKLSLCFFLGHFILFSLLAAQEKGEETLRLKIGDEKLKDKVMEIFPGKIYSAQLGKPVEFSRMISEMEKARIVYVGESHNSLPMHEIQLRILEALFFRHRNTALGLEMFPVTLQEVLNKWSLGILTTKEFIEEAEWYLTWNFNFSYYEEIFDFAKENSIPVYGLNVPRKIIRKIRMQGWRALSEEEKKLVPEPDVTNKEHRVLIRTIFESAEIPHQMKGRGMDRMFEGLYRAQSAWDEVMAHNVLKVAKREGRRVVVLAGSGHLIYNLGINRRAYEKSGLPFKTVIIVPVPEGKEGVLVARSLADYVFGIEEEERPVYPSIGLSLKKIDGLENIVIDSDPISGVAKGQDFRKGDVILSVDKRAFSSINNLRIYLSRFTWGDEVTFRLLRQAEEKEVVLKFELVEESKDKN